MSHELPHSPPDQTDDANNSGATSDILTFLINETTAGRVLKAMRGVEDREAVPKVEPDDLPAFVRGLRAIYRVAYNAHFLSSRELATELGKLLKGIKASSCPQELEHWTTPERFDHFAELFQAAALDIWIQTNREIDYRDFRVTIADSHFQSLRVIPALAEHILRVQSTFDQIDPPFQALWAFSDAEKLKRDIQLEYYKYFRKRKDQLPDKTIVDAIGAVYAAQFHEKFTVSETTKEFRKSDIHRFNNGFPIRFACATIRELKLHLLMAPIGRPKATAAPRGAIARKNSGQHALSPSSAPKHRSYDRDGNSLTVDIDAPFPWHLTRAEKKSARDLKNDTWSLPSDDWELVKNRIGDSWSNK